MCISVLNSLRLRLARTVFVAGLAGLAAGCSSDVSRFGDGFYTGAVPQAPLTQSAALQPYPGDVDRMSTGSVSAPGGDAGTYGSAPTRSVQSNELPPPPSPSYMAAPQRGQMTSSQSAAQAAERGAAPTRGAPPSTLQEQARQVSVPSERPTRSSASSRPTGNAATVKVASGDTLLAISRRTGVSVDAIKRANDMSDSTIRLGQTLVVPGASSSTAPRTAKTESASDKPTKTAEREPEAKQKPAPYTPPKTAEKSARPTAEKEISVAENKAAPATPAQAASEEKVAMAPATSGIGGFRWPVQGRVVNRFGEKVGSRRNDGLNISVPRGTAVKAAENGVVIYAGDGLKEFGNTVLVQHDDGLVTVYGHADKLEVKRGAKVTRGQEIAKSGMSGDTDVPVLHFEVRKNSTPVNPTKFLQ